jgi:uncharacterized membrane protein
MTRVDPELTRQLDDVSADDSPVQAVVYLESGEMMSPDEVSAAADRLIESATSKAATAPSRVNVLKNLGIVAVEAPASFVRSLIEEPGVASAIANVQPSADAGLETPGEPSRSPTDEQTTSRREADDRATS